MRWLADKKILIASILAIFLGCLYFWGRGQYAGEMLAKDIYEHKVRSIKVEIRGLTESPVQIRPNDFGDLIQSVCTLNLKAETETALYSAIHSEKIKFRFDSRFDTYYAFHFYDAESNEIHTIFLGEDFINYPYMSLIVDGVEAESGKLLIRWLDHYVPASNCEDKPAPHS